MKSGKTAGLIEHIDFLQYTTDIKYNLFKPKLDDRNKEIKSRKFEKTYKATIIETEKPELILNHITSEKIIAIDEIQFFKKGIAEVIEEIIKRDIQVIASGLNLDFRGEVYGEMGKLLSIATHPKILTAVCEYDQCNSKASRTQRLINGKPAPRDAKQNIIEGSNSIIEYQARCLHHHYVPK